MLRLPLLLTVLLSALLAGCATSGPFASPDPTVEAPRRNAASPDEAAIARRLDRTVDGWLGTPHRLGGTGRDGVDCSAFVQAVLGDVLGVSLPRTTEAQVRVGEPVAADALRTGDLVFFRPDKGTRHVGVVLGDGRFAHASSSQGVVRSRLEDPYWQRTYWTARRVLPDAPLPARPPEPLPARPPAPTRRAGW